MGKLPDESVARNLFRSCQKVCFVSKILSHTIHVINHLYNLDVSIHLPIMDTVTNFPKCDNALILFSLRTVTWRIDYETFPVQFLI